MKKSVEVWCPGRLTCFLNEGINSQGMKKFRLINQTIDLYDKLEITEDKKKKGIVSISGLRKNPDQEKLLYETSQLFFQYTNLELPTLNILIQKNIPSGIGLNTTDSLIAGLLNALNHYYNKVLTEEQITALAKKLGLEVPYYLKGGYALIQNEADNIQKLVKNPYDNYLLIKPDVEITKSNQQIINHPYDEQPISKHLYNDYLKFIKGELQELQEFLKNHPNLDYNLLSKGPLYYLAFKEKRGIGSLVKEIHECFPNYKLTNVKNSPGPKILVKYSEKLDIY